MSLPVLIVGGLHAEARTAVVDGSHRVAAGSPELTRLAFAGFDTEAAAAAQHPACALLPHDADEAGVATLVRHRCRPFRPEPLYAALEDLASAAARSRGRFRLADRPDTPLSWDAVSTAPSGSLRALVWAAPRRAKADCRPAHPRGGPVSAQSSAARARAPERVRPGVGARRG